MKATRAVVDSAIHLNRSDLGDKVAEKLRQHFSVANPDFVFKRRLRRTPHGIPHKLYAVEEIGNELIVPRGLARETAEILKRSAIGIEFEDRRTLPTFRLEIRAKAGLGYLYQRQAADALLRASQGYVVLPCGGGKTIAGCLAMARAQTPTIVLVPTNDLVEQWIESARAVLTRSDGSPLGKLVGNLSKEGVSPITVATIQTFRDWEPLRTQAFFAQFGLTIVDEVHHVPAVSIRRVVNWAPGRFRLGLTATPEREDGLTELMPWYLGSVLIEKSHQELVDMGVLVVPDVRAIETRFHYSYAGQADWAGMLSAIVSDTERNALIVSHVEREARAGCVCLVLSGRREHCEALGAMLNARGVATNVVTGAKTKKQRKTMIEGARAVGGSTKVLCATSLADEGLDLPILSRVFLVWPGRAQARTTQRLGRLMRPHENKPKPVLFDFGDVRVPHLRRQLLKRRKTYEKILGAQQGELRLDAEAAALPPDDEIDEVA